MADNPASTSFDPFAGPAIVATAPTTEPQREIWTACALGDDASRAFNESITLMLDGPLNTVAFSAAFDALTARHDALCSTLSADGLTLFVGEAPLGGLRFTDLFQLDEPSQQAHVAEARKRAVTSVFDLTSGPLYRAELLRLSDHEHVVVFSAHHIVFDGWSNGVLLADWATLYAQQLGLSPEPAPAPSFAAYARAQASLPPEIGFADEAYWVQRFQGHPTSVDLPSDRLRPPLKTYSSGRVDVTLEPALITELRRTGASFKASLFATLFSAFGVLIHRLSQQEDVVIGIPTAGQMLADDTALVGHCVNMLPIRNTLQLTEPFCELLERARTTLLDAQDHQRFTFGKLLTKLPLPRDPSRLPLVSVIFNVDRPAEDVRFPELRLRLASNPRAFENFDLFLNIVEAQSGVVLECQYNSDLFDAATIERWLSAYDTLLRGIVRDPKQALGALPLLSEAELAQLELWNQTQAEFPRRACVHELVAQAAASAPDSVACEFEGQQLTYAQLLRRAQAFSAQLRRMGVKRGSLVGLCVERSPELIIGALAIWLAGGAYVPMDPGYPRERLAQMLEDSAAPVLVTETRVNQELALSGAALAFVDQASSDAELTAVEHEPATPEDAAYVIYTSGSTGKPKGVLVPHRAVVNLLTSVAKQPGMDRHDVVLAVTTLSFDIAVSEIWLPLSVGAKIVLVTRDTAADGSLLRAVVEKSGVSFIDATPATYRLLLGAGWHGDDKLKLICTGEALPLDLARVLNTCSGSLWNGYGPTETTVWSTFWRVPAELSRVLIGRPVANTQIHILDEQRRPVPINVPGEIYIAGAGVTHGYLNRPDLTDDRFVDNPFVAGARMYRTGDLGRYLPNGDIECLGRNDNQVKLRGFRIELGEIESALGQHPSIGQVAVIKREDRAGDAKLVAYFVVTGERVSASVLRTHLKQTLPDYMLPAAFVSLDRMPLTPSGKIDRRALPAPEAEAPRSDAEFVAPSTPMELVLAELWSSMLGVGRISVHDDFFALGGHSLLASQILARLRRDHGIHLSFRKFFEAPTVARLAKQAEAAAGESAPERPPLVRRAPGTPVPLSLAQERIALMEQMHPAQQMTHSLPAAWQITGPVDVERLQAALDLVVQRHETLRTVIKNDAGRLMQDVREPSSLRIEQRDLRDLAAEDRRPQMMEDIRRRTATPFDLGTGPLFSSVLYRLEDEVFVYFTLRHNLIWDGWSYDVFLADLTESYSALAEARPPQLAELPIAYGDYVIWQREWLKSSEIAQQRDWWHKELADSPPDLELPYDFPRPTRMRYEGGTIIARVSKEQSLALTALAHQANTTLFMTLLAAYAALLHRFTGRDDILVGLPVRGRQAPELENLIGSFTNTIVLRARVNPEAPFLDFLKTTRDRALDAFSHEQLPLEMLEIRPPVVRALFSFQDARTRPVGMHGATLKQVDVEPPAAANDLMCWMVERPDHLVAVVNYSRELFRDETIERLVRGFQTLLDDVVRHPEKPLNRLQIIHEQDAQTLAAGAPSELGPAVSLPELLSQLSAQGRQSPLAVQAEQALQLAELERQSASLAAVLLRRGVLAGDVVALCAPASTALIAAAWAVFRTGACVLAMDPRAPSAFRDQLLLGSGAKLALLGDPEQIANVPGLPPQLPLSDALAESAEAVLPAVPASSDAWLRVGIEADGTPSFTRVSHADISAAARRLAVAAGLVSGEKLRCALAPSSESFALELALPLICEVTLALPPVGATPAEAVLESAWSQGATAALATASELVELRASGAILPGTAIVFGGAPAELASKLREETTRTLVVHALDTAAAFVLLLETPSASAALHGTPLVAERAVVLDRLGQPVPAGVAGELQLESAGSARATGLRARATGAQTLELLPAAETRLEMNGQRFAAAAVARAIEQHPAVASAVVVRESAGLDGFRLVCYVVPRAGASFTESELRRQARATLPAALVPHVFVEILEVPRDAHGRLEQAKLPSPYAAPKLAHVAPRSDAEKLLARLFTEVLGVPKVGVHDNFFDLGGQSLLCLRVIDMIEKQTGRRISPRVLLLNTLEQAASALGQEQAVAPLPQATSGAPGGVAGRVLKGLRGLLRG